MGISILTGNKQQKYREMSRKSLLLQGNAVKISPVTLKVLTAIRGHGAALTKAEIVRKTELSLATVTEHVGLLLARGLVREEDCGASTGGRKPKLYGFNADAGRIVAIDLESTHVRVAVVDFGLTILHAIASAEVDVANGPESVLAHLKDLVFAALKAARVDRRDVKAIGMGVPGPVNHTLGVPSSLSIMPGWENFPIRPFWAAHFECPVHVDNNVYTMALGERTLDPAAAPSDMIFVKIGNGIGAGIVLDGRIYRGATENAGEIGHTNTGHDTLCYCGNCGCLEAFAGGRAIALRAEALAREGRSETLSAMLALKNRLSLADVIKALEESDPVAVALIRDSGDAIGGVLANLVDFFNPSHIVIGGGVSQVGDVLLAAIRQSIYRQSLPLLTRRLAIEHSAVGANAGLAGAAVLALDDAIQKTFAADGRARKPYLPAGSRAARADEMEHAP